MPVLEVLKKENVRNVAIVVTRYFGGIKLGTGGLVRAYTKGAKIALESAKIITRVLYQTVIVSVDYTLLGSCLLYTSWLLHWQNSRKRRGAIFSDII